MQTIYNKLLSTFPEKQPEIDDVLNAKTWTTVEKVDFVRYFTCAIRYHQEQLSNCGYSEENNQELLFAQLMYKLYLKVITNA